MSQLEGRRPDASSSELPVPPLAPLVDTHCHLGDRRFDEDRARVIERARLAGVIHVVIVADSAGESLRVRELARELDLSATAGVHPHVASTWNADTAAAIEAALADPCVVAVGETGLDYHYEHSPRADQKRAFEAQLALAAKHRKPVVVHSRDADQDMSAMLRGLGPGNPRIILHSFSSGPAVFEIGLEIDAYFSFSGMITFKSWKRQDFIANCPPSRLLLETDAPYLAPVPFRGRRNEPAFLVETAKEVARILGVDPGTIAQRSTANAVECFGSRLTYQKGENR
ncbi:MAG: LuxR family transcriptional regulator [Gemmatimonadales bacterium]|nr:MAG: LuxR family transcriptional regulator [Gemmatimonadales bacterium]